MTHSPDPPGERAMYFRRSGEFEWPSRRFVMSVSAPEPPSTFLRRLAQAIMAADLLADPPAIAARLRDIATTLREREEHEHQGCGEED